MTLYQQLEKDLLKCGWNVEQGKGDHMKFTKPGVPTIVTISRSISGRGCALQNCLARIRKFEPNFWRDRTVVVPEEETIDYGAFPDIKPWMYPGETVRWTAAEGRDYSKLSDPGSVMNTRYVVVEVVPVGENEPGKARLTISPDGDDDREFQVSPEDIDAWETGVCCVCGKTKPVNRLCTHGEEYVCPGCVATLVAKKKRVETPQVELPETREEEIPDSPGFRIIKEIRDEYRGIPFAELPEEAMARLRDGVSKLSARERRAFKKAAPTMFASLVSPEKKEEKVYPYDAWRKFAAELVARKRPGCPRKYQDMLSNVLANAHYTLRNKVIAGETMAVYDIMVDDYDLLLDIWSMGKTLFFEMMKAHKDSDIYFRLCCQKHNIFQYVVPPCGEHVRKLVDWLVSVVPEKERNQLSRASLDSSVADIVALRKKVIGCIKEAAPDLCGEDDCNFAVRVYLALRDCDRERFEDALPYCDIDVEYNVSVYDAEMISKIRQRILETDFGAPYAISFTGYKKSDRGEVTECFGDYFADSDCAGKVFRAVMERNEVYGPELGQILFKVAHEDDGICLHLSGINKETEPEEYREYSEKLTGVFSEIISNFDEPDILRVALRAAFDRVVGKLYNVEESRRKEILSFWDIRLESDTNNENNRNKQNNNTVTMNNYLDFTNPDAENQAAGALTTRELLRELKARGVSFDNLQITIKSNINIDEI